MLWQVLKTQITKIDIYQFLHTRQHILRLIILIWKLKPRWYQYKQIDLVLTLLTHTCQKTLLPVHHLLLGVNQVVMKPIKSELWAACAGCCEDDDVFRALLFGSCPYVVTLLAPLESWIHFKWGLFTTDGSILSQNTKVQGYLKRISELFLEQSFRINISRARYWEFNK